MLARNHLPVHCVMHDRVHRLTWHESIPPDEIWVKIGGDKGGGSFKMNFQICNLHHPNSPSNTCVFCIFEAPDSPVNLQFALGRYKHEINSLESKTWRQVSLKLICQTQQGNSYLYRGKSIKVFLSGDYEFLCAMYGLSGASDKSVCYQLHT